MSGMVGWEEASVRMAASRAAHCMCNLTVRQEADGQWVATAGPFRARKGTRAKAVGRLRAMVDEALALQGMTP